jgi:hypothetical protein
MENEAYHQHPAISKSHLDLIARSPLHYWARYIDPNRKTPEPTASMAIGTAVHTHVLELDQWDSRYAIAPEGIDRRTKAGKEEWHVFTTAAQGRKVLKREDAEQVMAMGRSVLGHRSAAALLAANGQPEDTFMWTDEATGLQCKCRPDYMHSDGSTIVDLKTTRDASPRGFRHSVIQYRYHVQAAWYLHGVEQATGKRPERFVFVAVESSAPYASAVYEASAEMIEAGMIKAREDLALLAECKLRDNWPSYSDEIQSLTLPPWMLPGAGTGEPVTMPDNIEGF